MRLGLALVSLALWLGSFWLCTENMGWQLALMNLVLNVLSHIFGTYAQR